MVKGDAGRIGGGGRPSDGCLDRARFWPKSPKQTTAKSICEAGGSKRHNQIRACGKRFRSTLTVPQGGAGGWAFVTWPTPAAMENEEPGPHDFGQPDGRRFSEW